LYSHSTREEPTLRLKTEEKPFHADKETMQHGTRMTMYSGHIFEKYSNMKYHEYPTMGAKLFYAGGRTDRQMEVKELVVAFCNFAYTSKNYYMFN
jgi:hypothetical protein